MNQQATGKFIAQKKKREKPYTGTVGRKAWSI